VTKSATSSLQDYIHIARIDHWFKNVFMLPGVALALILSDIPLTQAFIPVLIGILSTCLVASANYVINEWLDAEFDRHHPLKQHRPSAAGNIQAKFVYLEYTVLVAVGLTLASLLTSEFLVFSIILLIMGLLYNVQPFRTKDRVYLDVLSESVNNPLRLLLGWSTLVSGVLPPSSIWLAYWMGGAFLMAMKRFAEYRFIDDPEKAGQYRRSFIHYTEQSLLLSSFFYAISSAFFLGIFLIKYRIEFLLSFPLFALLFVWYTAIAMKPHSHSQTPEKLYREPIFLGYVLFLGAVITILFFVDIPWMKHLVEPVHFTNSQ
jgi:4-hydroxybenzoate polyprenyltransferase